MGLANIAIGRTKMAIYFVSMESDAKGGAGNMNSGDFENMVELRRQVRQQILYKLFSDLVRSKV